MNNEEIKVTTEETNEQKPKRNYKIFVIIFVVVLVTHFVRTGGCGKEDDNLPTAEELEQADGFTAEDGPIITEDGLIITPVGYNATNNPRIMDVVNPEAEPQPVAGDAVDPEFSQVYAPVLSKNTAIPEGINYDYQYYYSGVFARYCEWAYDYGAEDPRIFEFALGDIEATSGESELIIQRPDDSMIYDVYTLNSGYPLYMGSTEPIFTLDCRTAFVGSGGELFVFDWVSADEIDLHRYKLERDECGNRRLTGGIVYRGSKYSEEFDNIIDDYYMYAWSDHGNIGDGIIYPTE